MSQDQHSLFYMELESGDPDRDRGLLDQLLTESRLYKSGQDYRDLLDFVGKFPQFAPFNAMLLQIQKPGLSFATSAYDWKRLFNRTIKLDARPLLIMWPFSPVALVYDVLDTEGKELPQDVMAFYARGTIDAGTLASFRASLEKKNIQWDEIDAGDNKAGSIRMIECADPKSKKGRNRYRMGINKNHQPAVQFSTLAHELAHLFLGHLGADKPLNIADRSRFGHDQKEIEAESTAYLVCKRNGVTPGSERYLSDFVGESKSSADIDMYSVMRAAGHVESLLGLGKPTKFSKR